MHNRKLSMNWIKAVKVVDAIILFSSLMKEYQAWPRSGIPRVKVKFSRRLQPIQGWLCDDLTFRIRQFVCWSGRGINGSRVLVMVLFTDRWSSSYWYFMTLVMTLCSVHMEAVQWGEPTMTFQWLVGSSWQTDFKALATTQEDGELSSQWWA